MTTFTESVVEDATLAWLESLGYVVKHGPGIAPGGFKRTDRREVASANRERGVSARNATTQREGNVQKMHIALKGQN
jgi:type I restriction enzyme R subunit